MIAKRRNVELRLLVLPVAVVALCLASFWPAADAEFLNWDDPLTLTRNHDLQGLDGASLRWMWTTSRAGHYQPASWMTLAADLTRFGLEPSERPDASGYHRTNLLLHAAGAVALYFLAFELLARAFRDRDGTRLAVAAAFAALLHAVHPLRCESVCWVTERRDVLSGLFFFLALLGWVRATPEGVARLRRGALAGAAASAAVAMALFFASVSTADPRSLHWRGPGAAGLALAVLLWLVSGAFALRACPGRRLAWGAGALACLLASLLAKAWGMVMPALLLVLDAWPLRRLSAPEVAGAEGAAGLRRRALLALLLEKAPFLAASGVFGWLARWAQLAQQGNLDFWQDHGPLERIVQALYGIAFYPARTLLPTGLVPLYQIPDDLFTPRLLAVAAASVGVTLLLVGLVRRAPALLAAWAAYVVIVSPVLGVLQSGPQFVADRYTYLACAPFALLAGGALYRFGRGRRVVPVHAAALALVALLAVLTFRQSEVWRSSESLWTHAWSDGAPTALAALNLGIVRMDQGLAAADPAVRAARYDEAAALFARGRELRPGYEVFDANEAILTWRRARALSGSERTAALERASQLAERAIAARRAKGLDDASYLFHHGLILLEAGRIDEATARFEEALALDPGWPDARLYLASALLERAESRAMANDARAALALSARARQQIAVAGAVSRVAGRASFLLGSALDLDSQVLAGVGRHDDARASRAEARRAYAAVPGDDPLAPEARARVERLASDAAPRQVAP